MYPDKFALQVKQGDINNGRRTQSNSCPVALALIRQGWADPCVGKDDVLLVALGPPNFNDPSARPMATVTYRAEGLYEFVRNFDGWGTVKPVTLSFVLASEEQTS